MTTLLVALLLSQSQTMPRTVICDKGFDCATVTGGKLDVNSSVTLGDVSVAVFADPSGNTTVHRLDADGKVQIAGTINASSSATATAAAPSYGEGTSQAFSQTLAGRLRTITQVDPAVVSTVAVSNFPASQAVTGTFWQATQPVSGTLTCNAGSGTLAVSGPLTDTQLRATPVPVSGTVTASVDPTRATSVVGTFWQATQPVSIASMPSTPVTGTFWQTTQPVSIASMPSTPVTGTFWQATQPVSGTVTASVDPARATTVVITTGSSVIGKVQIDPAAVSTVNVGGTVAHAATWGGVPVPLGAYVEADSAAMDSASVVDGDMSRLKADIEGRLYVRTDHANRGYWSSGLVTATTLTQAIAAPGASLSIYITEITFSASVASTTTTDQQMTLKYGTGSNCGTGTGYLWGAFGPANGGAHATFSTPIKVTANNAVCWIHAAAGSKIVNIAYYTAP